MQKDVNNLKNKKTLAVGLILLVAGLVSFFYWANKKQVWFCDEIYTYESANGFEQEWPASYVDEWMTGADVEAFFAADSDKISLNAITVRLYNDHVPLYFWLFRLVSFFFFKGSGSIWIGLSINLVFYLIILMLGYKVFLHLTNSPLLSGAVMFLTHISNRLMLEQITTLRMYVMLLLMELLLLLGGLWILHDADGSRMKPGVFFFLFSVSVAGMLTHYDFWIFYAVTATFFCAWLLILALKKGRKFWCSREFGYVLAWMGNFACSLLTTMWLFPYCRWNLNRGKGQLALKSVFVFSMEKVNQIFWGYESLAHSLFGGTFPAAGALLIIFACVAGGILILGKKREKKKMVGMILLVFIALAYQFIVCFTLPDAREERYLWGGFTVIMLCMAWGGILILQELYRKMRDNKVHPLVQYLISAVLAVAILIGEYVVIDGGNGVAYLFHPEKDMAVLREHSKIPWIVYGPTVGVYSYYDWIIPESICYMSQENTDEDAAAFRVIEDEDKFILYVYEDYLPQALDFFTATSDHNFTASYLTKSTNLTVYLIEVE